MTSTNMSETVQDFLYPAANITKSVQNRFKTNLKTKELIERIRIIKLLREDLVCLDNWESRFFIEFDDTTTLRVYFNKRYDCERLTTKRIQTLCEKIKEIALVRFKIEVNANAYLDDSKKIVIEISAEMDINDD